VFNTVEESKFHFGFSIFGGDFWKNQNASLKLPYLTRRAGRDQGMFILAVAVRKVVRAFGCARVRHFFVERIGLVDAAVYRAWLRRSESGQGQKSDSGKSGDVVFHSHFLLQNVTIS